jgi:hypothetical protein
MIKGINAKREVSPMINNIEHKNSAKVAMINEASTPRPKGSLNRHSPFTILSNLGYPWVSIAKPVKTLRIKSPILMRVEGFPVLTSFLNISIKFLLRNGFMNYPQ